MKVHEAWSAVMADVQSVSKDSRNQSQNFNFRGIDAVVNAVGPALRKHGVVVMPVDAASRTRDVTVGRNQTAMREVTVTVIYRVFGPEGDSFDGQALGEAMDSGDKATPKAMSVAYRTFLLQALTIPTDEPDPDSQSFERADTEQDGVIAQLAELVHGFPADGWQMQVMGDAKRLHKWPATLGEYTMPQAMTALVIARKIAAAEEPFELEGAVSDE